MNVRHTAIPLLCSVVLVMLSTSVFANLKIASTIRPLHFIALAVLGEQGEARVLIDNSASPHHFNLSPGDRLTLAESDIVVWIGPELESHLDSTIPELVDSEQLITVIQLPGLKTHNINEKVKQLDAHVWLDTKNASVIANEIARRAERLDSANSGFYRANLQEFLDDLDQLNDSLFARFSAASTPPFAVYHNGFQYFEKQFGVTHELEFVSDPEVTPTIAQIINTRELIAKIKPVCLFSEPDANSELIETLLSGYSPNEPIRKTAIDLLGNRIAQSPSAYIELITHVANVFGNCLHHNEETSTENNR